MKHKNFFIVPNQIFELGLKPNEYSKQNHQSISRRTLYYSRSGVVLTRRNYSVGGMTYQVNSFFCPSRCPSADEGLRRLMQQEIENNS